MPWGIKLAPRPRQTGQVHERTALKYLCRHGLLPVTTNYQCRQGEIDLIMLDGDCLVFVEVRYRSGNRFGGGLASVDRFKQQRIATTAGHFLANHAEFSNHPCRFDVIALSGGPGKPDFEWIKGAFSA